MTNLHGSLIDGTQCLEERSLVVQRLASVCNKDRRDAERIIHHENRGGRIPCTVSASLEGITYSPVREGRSIRLLLNQETACELFHDTALAIVLDECVVLFSRALRKGLEPVSIMRSPDTHGPLLHSLGD